MASTLFLLLTLSPHLVFTYNIDISSPIIYADPEPGGSENYFGYTVALAYRKRSSPASSLFVGAPKFSNGTGKVYRCTKTGTGSLGTTRCRGLEVDTRSAPSQIELSQLNGVFLYIGKSGGLGASMAVGESTNLTVCAPYSVIRSRDTFRPSQQTYEDMRGYCYSVPDAVGDALYRDNDPLKNELRYPIGDAIHSLYGFSVDYSVKKGSDPIYRIVGQPRVDHVSINKGPELLHAKYNCEDLDNLGYSVSSGLFFHNKQVALFAGSPSWRRKGKVVILLPEIGRSLMIPGTTLGEYFGASLTTGDFDGDGLNDLAVGAPHWGAVDFGRVYVYFDNKDSNFGEGEGLILQGTVEYGQFGYTLASADLDRDGYCDLVVSAPWEGSGVVYVHYGSTDFKSRGSSMRIVQRLQPSEIMRHHQFERFGFSLSHPVDIDENGYPDLAIGAYKSGHAVILRGRPVIKTNVIIVTYPDLLQRTDTNFVVSVCAEYQGVNVPHTQELEFDMAVDEDHKRVEANLSNTFTAVLPRNRPYCTNQTITLKKGNVFFNPIVIRIKHRIREKDTGNKFCPTCPVLSRKDFQESAQKKLPFNTGCKNSEICNARLSITANFGGAIKDDNQWVVGSGDISLNLIVTNKGEPAYQTELIVEIPASVHLHKIIPDCSEEIQENGVSNLVCQIGNPLIKKKLLNITLDMQGIVESVEGMVLTFNITGRTRSNDLGDINHPISLDLKIKNVAYATLTGIADQESQNYRGTVNKSIVPIRHTYQVIRVGETPITKARLTIHVPVAIIGKKNAFLNITEPNFIDSSGQIRTCSVYGIGYQTEDPSHVDPEDNLLQRRRRDMSTITSPSVNKETDTETRNDTREKGVTATGQTTEQTIYLSCSTSNVSCVKIVCQFALSKTSHVGSMLLDMVYDANAFFTSNEDSLTVKFRTNASVKIILPSILDPLYIRNTTAEASTMLYNIPEPQKLSGWILPISIVLGFLIFIILALILFKIGFFNRPKKVETAKAKEKKLILKTCGSEDADKERYG